MKKTIWVLSIYSVVLFTFGCGKSNGEDPSFESSELLNVFVPFIESVEFPETIHAGERFEIRVTLSAEMKPDVFNGRIRNDGLSRMVLPFNSPLRPNEDPPPDKFWPVSTSGSVFFFEDHNLSGEPKTEYVVSGVIYVPGDFILRLTGATSREFGGLQASAFLEESVIFPSDNISAFDFPFTALPSMEEGTE